MEITTREQAINILIIGCDTNKISDGYHTFEELYEHRITLFIALCKCHKDRAWKSKIHHDGMAIPGWFIVGIGKEPNQQITYHVPITKWDLIDVEELDRAPKWDGHTSNDVVHRISLL